MSKHIHTNVSVNKYFVSNLIRYNNFIRVIIQTHKPHKKILNHNVMSFPKEKLILKKLYFKYCYLLFIVNLFTSSNEIAKEKIQLLLVTILYNLFQCYITYMRIYIYILRTLKCSNKSSFKKNISIFNT